MIPFLFTLTTWLVVTLPLSLLLVPFSSLTWLIAPVAALLIALPYAGIMWYALQKPMPCLRMALMQGISVGHASAIALLSTAPLVLLDLSEYRAIAAVLCALGVLSWGVMAAVYPKVKRLQFHSKQVQQPVRLAQLTDVHLGSRGASLLANSLAIAEREQPDAIVITGDLVDGGEVGATELASLARCTIPVYMVIGNHERYVDLEKLLDHIGAQGVTVLRNQQTDLGDLRLLGVDDSDEQHYLRQTLPTLEARANGFTVLLYHKPDDWDVARAAGVNLMLSGHTHAGQVWPFSYLVTRRHPHWRGLYNQDDQFLYVSPGTGCWGPIYRIGSRSEITVIDIQPG